MDVQSCCRNVVLWRGENMRQIILLMGFALLLPATAWTQELELEINGMVCAFCAQGIERSLKRDPAVKDVKVDLGEMRVDVSLHEGQELSKSRANEIVRSSGYELRNYRIRESN